MFDRLRRVSDGHGRAPSFDPESSASGGRKSRSRPAEVTLTRDHVAEAIRYLMYSSLGASRVPLLPARSVQRQLLADCRLPDSLACGGHVRGLYLSITCAEDVPLVAPDAAERTIRPILAATACASSAPPARSGPAGLVPRRAGRP